MRKRPLCPVCLILILTILILKAAGAPVFGAPVLNRKEQKNVDASKSMNITGVVQDRRETENSEQYILKNSILSFPDGSSESQHSTSHKIYMKKLLVMTEKGNYLPIGSEVSFRGDPQRIEQADNPGQFDTAEYYACRRIYYRVWGEKIRILRGKNGDFHESMMRIRDRISAAQQDLMHEDAAGVLACMLQGDRQMLTQESRDTYRISGTMAALCISGLHISMIGMGAFRLLQIAGLPVPPAALLATALISLYGVFAGNPVSALRACLMFAVLMGARAWKKSYDTASSLSAAGILLLLVNPGYLFYSGFQMSFAAMAGLSAVCPVLLSLLPENFWKHSTKRQKRWKKMLQSVLSYVSIMLTVLPLTARYFYEIPLWGMAANLVLMPLMEVVMGLGIAGSLAALFSRRAGRLLLFPVDSILTGYQMAAGKIRNIPGSVWICGQPEWSRVAIYYSILILTVCLCRQKVKERVGNEKISGINISDGKRKFRREDISGYNRKRDNHFTGIFPVILFLSAGIMILFWKMPEPFSLTMLDVGQGDCLCIRAGNTCFLVDGGSTSVQHVGTYRILPYLKQQGIRTIDGIFLTHGDADHTGGIAELLQACADRTASLRVKTIILPAWMREESSIETGSIWKSGISDRSEEGAEQKGEDSHEGAEETLTWKKLAQRTGAVILHVSEGDSVSRGSLKMRVLHPLRRGGEREGNAGSLVLDVRYETFRMLLTGDLEGQGEEEVLPMLEDCDLLKVAHHGSRNSTSEKFLAVTRPEIAFISAPAKSIYGHPHRELLERLAGCGADCFITRDCGAVRAEYDGEKVRIRKWK